MSDRRKAQRLDRKGEVTMRVISGGNTLTKGNIIYNFSKNVSESGAKIQVNSFLPLETLLNISITLYNPLQTVTALGKVKWINSVFADEFYEAGLEFVYAYRE